MLCWRSSSPFPRLQKHSPTRDTVNAGGPRSRLTSALMTSGWLPNVPSSERPLSPTPEPLYHDFFAMLMRVPGFVLEGDTLAAMQNARALHRAMNVMRTLGR